MEISKEWLIYITGHSGMVGQSLLKILKEKGYSNFICSSIEDFDLRDQEEVNIFFREHKPDIVIHLAAKVGGIMANIKNPADFIYDNIMMQTNVINSAHVHNCKKLVFLGSSCIYPKESPQPMKEDYFLTGKLEPTNQSYAVAKIAGIQLCQSYSKQYGDNFICPLPSNLYGPGDHFGTEESHVLSAFIDKIHKAKIENQSSISIWGTGKPRREFLYVTDIADAIIFLLENYNSPDIINVGSGSDIAIKDLADKIKHIIGYEGKILLDKNKPDGMMRKLLDITKIKKLGWEPKVSLDEGIKKTYEYYLKTIE